MWFYALRNQQQGPVNEDALKKLLQDRTIDGSTLVWKEGMAQWTPLAQTELVKFLPKPTSMPSAAPVVPATPAYPQTAMPGSYQPYNTQLMKPAAERLKQLNTLFKAWWILLLSAIGAIFIGVLLSTLLLVGTSSSSAYGIIGSLITFLGIPAAIAAAVIQFILLYKYWESIQAVRPRTTPGKAVGYLFIPFYQFYWFYEAFYGLSKDMNFYLNAYSVPGERLNEGLALAYCILVWCSVIPFVDYLTAPAAGIIFLIMMPKWKNAAARIIEQQQQAGG